jgi:hypothetical protein
MYQFSSGGKKKIMDIFKGAISRDFESLIAWIGLTSVLLNLFVKFFWDALK